LAVPDQGAAAARKRVCQAEGRFPVRMQTSLNRDETGGRVCPMPVAGCPPGWWFDSWKIARARRNAEFVKTGLAEIANDAGQPGMGVFFRHIFLNRTENLRMLGYF